MSVTQKEILAYLREKEGCSSDTRLDLLDRIEREGIAPPDGYVIVPIEPTGLMLKAAHETIKTNSFYAADGALIREPNLLVYKAMLAAAPKPEVKP